MEESGKTTTPGSRLSRPGVELNFTFLSGLFQLSWERENFPTLLWRYPLHLRFEPWGSVKLNHLCHNQPPIHSRLPVLLQSHRDGCSAQLPD